MNQKNELKILELKLKMFSKQYSKTEMIINTILICVTLSLYDRLGLFWGIIISIILSFITNNTIIKQIKKQQEDLKL